MKCAGSVHTVTKAAVKPMKPTSGLDKNDACFGGFGLEKGKSGILLGGGDGAKKSERAIPWKKSMGVED